VNFAPDQDSQHEHHPDAKSDRCSANHLHAILFTGLLQFPTLGRQIQSAIPLAPQTHSRFERWKVRQRMKLCRPFAQGGGGPVGCFSLVPKLEVPVSARRVDRFQRKAGHLQFLRHHLRIQMLYVPQGSKEDGLIFMPGHQVHGGVLHDQQKGRRLFGQHPPGRKEFESTEQIHIHPPGQGEMLRGVLLVKTVQFLQSAEGQKHLALVIRDRQPFPGVGGAFGGVGGKLLGLEADHSLQFRCIGAGQGQYHHQHIFGRENRSRRWSGVFRSHREAPEPIPRRWR
jgi:hypothetical protein